MKNRVIATTEDLVRNYLEKQRITLLYNDFKEDKP